MVSEISYHKKKSLQIVKPFPLRLIPVEKKCRPNGSNDAGYREYTIDEFLEALEIILFNIYIQSNVCNFKQILAVPIGGNGNAFLLLPSYTCHGADIA